MLHCVHIIVICAHVSQLECSDTYTCLVVARRSKCRNKLLTVHFTHSGSGQCWGNIFLCKTVWLVDVVVTSIQLPVQIYMYTLQQGHYTRYTPVWMYIHVHGTLQQGHYTSYSPVWTSETPVWMYGRLFPTHPVRVTAHFIEACVDH